LGGILVLASQLASWPIAATLAGSAAIALGLVLPIRSLGRRLGSRRRSARVREAIGDGLLLRVDHPIVESLVDACDAVDTAAHGVTGPSKAQMTQVAHAAAVDVASLLDGRRPTTTAELDYVRSRVDALRELVAVAAAAGDVDERARRTAAVDARAEVDEAAGRSTIGEIEQLTDRLRRAGDG
jgi:hypothetical protein